MIRFEEARHLYWWGDDIIPSVTQILGDNGWISDFCKSKTHADKGTEIHRMVELACTPGDLDSFELYNLIEKYPEQYRQWREFLSETGFQIHSVEEVVHGSVSFYRGSTDPDYWPDWAGTRDLYGYMPSVKKTAVVDLKTGAQAPPQTHLQTAGYTLAEHPLDYLDISRWSLRLDGKPGKKYKLKEYDKPDDFRVWVEEVERWQRNQQQLHP